ncbi:MAG TPA: beta-propeller fold lactonase family protein, partial [Blastocatellia bacterium]|nr:beta-propeller fold lactonase family protein [Blastocatellia bacterium]
MRGLLNQVLWIALSAMTVAVAGSVLTTLAQAATFVYVSNAESNDIYVFQLNRQTGELTLIETVQIPGVVKSGMSTPLA